MKFIKASWVHLLASAALLAAFSTVAHAAPGYGTVNLALGKEIVPITITALGSPAGVTDGEPYGPGTYWYSDTGGCRFTIDLGAEHSIGKINLWTQQTQAFRISSSTDGTTWTVRHDYNWGAPPNPYYAYGSPPLTVPVDGAYSARYLKYEASNTSWAMYVGIIEFEVYGWVESPPPPDLSGLANLAQNVPVVPMWPSVSGHDPELITDGDPGTYWQGAYSYNPCDAMGSCVSGGWRTTHGYSYVDLGSSQSIQAIRLHLPAPTTADGIQTVYMYLSNDPTGSPKIWWGIWGDPSMIASNTPVRTSSATQTFYLPAPVQAQYLFVQTGTWFTQGPRPPGVAEVEVFGQLPVETYTITASAGPNGSVSPSGAVTVNAGDSTTFAIAAAAGHHVADVLVDGASVGAVGSYTFPTVAADHTISATFAPDIFKIMASAGPNGGITPSGPVMANSGADQTFTIAAAAGYHIADVLVDGASVGAVGSYTFPAVAADHTISASFAIDAPTMLFGGLKPPYAPPPATFKAGRAIPLKWQYTDARGVVVKSASASPAVSYSPAPCGATVGGAATRITVPGDSGLTYEAATGTWHINWKTTGVPAGCYLLLVTSPTAQTSPPIPIKLVK